MQAEPEKFALLKKAANLTGFKEKSWTARISFYCMCRVLGFFQQIAPQVFGQLSLKRAKSSGCTVRISAMPPLIAITTWSKRGTDNSFCPIDTNR